MCALAHRCSLWGRRGGFAYSGDTEWVEALVKTSRDADLFVCECYSGASAAPNHVDWPMLRANLPRLAARSLMVTHLGHKALGKIDEIRAASVAVAEDGLVLDL